MVEKNCVYLEPEVHGAFVSVYVDAWVRKELPPAGSEGDDIREARRRMSEFPIILFKAVNLPLLANESTERVSPTVREQHNGNAN